MATASKKTKSKQKPKQKTKKKPAKKPAMKAGKKLGSKLGASAASKKNSAKKAAKKVSAKPTKKAVGKAKQKQTSASKKQPKSLSAKKTAKTDVSGRTSPLNSSLSKSAMDIGSFAPLNDHILVQPDGASDRTPGGLFIPATVKDRPLRGLVLAVGKGAFNKKGKQRPLDVQVGERVLYGQYAGTQVSLKGQELLILREEDVLGVSKTH